MIYTIDFSIIFYFRHVQKYDLLLKDVKCKQLVNVLEQFLIRVGQQGSMFSRIGTRLHQFFKQGQLSSKTNSSLNHWTILKGISIPLLAFGCYNYLPEKLKSQQQLPTPQKTQEKEVCHPLLSPNRSKSILSMIWSGLSYMVRFFQLLIFFLPPLLLSPLMLFKRTQDYWMDLFVKAIERSGVVFIKAFQYLSHRRDIIGPQLASKFEYLREQAPYHSYQTTLKYFRQSYGKEITEIFDDFDPTPIASGSVSQVYQAKYKGKKVAVKVRHPNVDIYIQRDIDILFFISYLASFISPSYEIPISYSSLKRTLIQQIDFTFEMKNLNTFNEMFKGHKQFKFPLPVEENTKEMVLIESFVEGRPVTYFQLNKHPLNKVIAKLGSELFFEMLMKNNFVHADCHGGNIFIQTKQQSYNFFTQIWDFFKDIAYVLSYRLKAETVDSQSLKLLYLEYCEQQFKIRKLMRQEKEKIIINLLDAGMVIKLNEIDKRAFVTFIKAVIEGRGDDCAQMIFNLSKYQGNKLNKAGFTNYKKQLQKVFQLLDGKPYSELQGMTLFHNMLATIRRNKMKLDGQFATLLTNILVLEGIARDIDPDINILKCAFPYFKYVEDFTPKEKSKTTQII